LAYYYCVGFWFMYHGLCIEVFRFKYTLSYFNIFKYTLNYFNIFKYTFNYYYAQIHMGAIKFMHVS